MTPNSLLFEFQDSIISWFKRESRNLCWRKQTLNEWEWLVLELLLKKTRAETVNIFFKDIINKYHSPFVVIATSDQELEDDLKVLGLQSQRREALKKIAQEIIVNFNGQIPLEYADLLSLPHVGRYTANAMLCFLKNEKRAIVDVNVARIITRVFGLEMPKDLREEWIWDFAEKILPERNWKKYNYSLLDLGALICRSKPNCTICILKTICKFAKNTDKSKN